MVSREQVEHTGGTDGGGSLGVSILVVQHGAWHLVRAVQFLDYRQRADECLRLHLDNGCGVEVGGRLRPYGLPVGQVDIVWGFDVGRAGVDHDGLLFV